MLEVVARIGDSIIDIVEGPCRAHDGSPLVTPGTVTIGVVTYTIARIEPTADRVPRPRIERRPYGYLAVSLTAQLALWIAAVTVAPFERCARPVHARARIARALASEPPPERTLAPPPERTLAPSKPAPKLSSKRAPKPPVAGAHAAAAVPSSKRGVQARDELDRLAGDPAAQIRHLAKTLDAIDVAGQLARTDGPVVDPTDDSGGFGGGGRRMKFDDTTYKVERWALPTFVRSHKGELAPMPAIEWCDEDSCLTRGALTIEQVIAILGTHQGEIAQCYREHTGDLVGTARVRFPIGTDGRVTGTLGAADGPVGYGTGTVGRCIAKIAQDIRWPKAREQTYVFVGLAFRPAAG